MNLRFYIFMCLFIEAIASFAVTPDQKYIRMVTSPDTILSGSSVQIKIHLILDSVPLTKNTIVKILIPKEFSQFAFDNNPLPFPLFPTLQHGYCLAKGNKSWEKATIQSINSTKLEFPD